MGLDKFTKKFTKTFLGEPFVWVCLAMVGVVMMGPSAANLARKVVGGDRSRGNVDEHGESINQTFPISSNVPSGNEMASSEMTSSVNSIRRQPLPEFRALPADSSVTHSDIPDRFSSDDKRNLTSADVPATSPLRQQKLRDAIKKSKEAASSISPDEQIQDLAADNSGAKQALENVKGEDSFDVDEMVTDVKKNIVGDSNVSELPAGSGTKDVASAVDTMAESADKAGQKLSETGQDLTESAGKELDRLEAAASEGSTSKANSIRDDLLSEESDTSPSSQEERSDAGAWSQLAESQDADVPEVSKGTAQWDNAVNDFAQSSQPERDHSTGSPPNESNEDSVFSPWDEPLTFNSGSESRGAAQDFSNSSNQPPTNDAIPSIAPESGSTWWDAMIAQQFWPERQAQFASIDSVVFMALQNSAQIQILNDRPHMEETFVQQREADFDWSAFVDASWSSINEPVRSELQTGSRTGRFEQDELSVSSGLQKRLDRGGELRVGSSIGTVDNNSIFLAPPDQGTSTFSLDYRQPLLRGRGREISQSQIVLARLNVEASRHSVKQQMQEYLVEVVTAYWDLYRARGVLSQRHRNYMRATEIVGRLSEHPSRTAGVQLQRAQATAGARHSEVIDAEYIVADAQERLMNLTHGDNLVNSNDIEIIPTDATPHSYLAHDLGHVTQLAVQNRAEVKEVLAEIKAASVRQVIALDGLKPQLDAIISSYVAGVRGNKDVGNAITDQFSSGDPSYAVGMSFEIPIGRRAANASTKREAIRRRMLENKLRKTLGDVSMSARSAFRDVYRLMAMTDNNRQVVTQSANALNSIQQDISWLKKDDPSAALFLNDLLGSQNRLAQAEQNLLDSQAQLAIAYVRLKRATGELLRDDAGVIESGSCSTCDCGGPQCDCENVSQATWHQPVEQSNSAFESGIENGIQNGKEFIHGIREKFQPSSPVQPLIDNFDIPLDRPSTPPGVTPVPLDADTAGEIFSAPQRYPLSSQRTSDWAPPRY